jgi:hypothetical protein
MSNGGKIVLLPREADRIKGSNGTARIKNDVRYLKVVVVTWMYVYCAM